VSARQGDYSWAVADGGSLWLATEYIPGDIDSITYFTNFGTFIYEVKLDFRDIMHWVDFDSQVRQQPANYLFR
jgi:hypothetical protein